MKNKKIKIELNSLFGKKDIDSDLAVIEMYKLPLEIIFGEELSIKATEEMKRNRKETNSINDINDFCLGVCLGMSFICKNEEFIKAYKNRMDGKKDEN